MALVNNSMEFAGMELLSAGFRSRSCSENFCPSSSFDYSSCGNSVPRAEFTVFPRSFSCISREISESQAPLISWAMFISFLHSRSDGEWEQRDKKLFYNLFRVCTGVMEYLRCGAVIMQSWLITTRLFPGNASLQWSDLLVYRKVRKKLQ